MNDEEVLRYVQASAVALGLTLDRARGQRVATHLARTAGMAAQLGAFPMCEADEPSEIYSPFAFPPAPSQRDKL